MAEPEEDSGSGVPEWVVTYGDMMSLLLTFFIMLVSMSKLKTDDGKTRMMMDAIRKAFGATRGSLGVPGRSLQKNSANGERASKGSRSEGGMESAGRSSPGSAGAHRAVSEISPGTLITLGGGSQFRRFDAGLSEQMRRNLDIVARVAGPKTNQIMIRGHASPEPLPTDADFVSAAAGGAVSLVKRPSTRLMEVRGLTVHDQFDLSFARARAVADYLVAKNIPRERLIVTAAGDTEFRVVTRRRDAQSWNRRVDVFLLDSYISPPQPAR